MTEGYNIKRAHNLEGHRIVSYVIACANRNPDKPFPDIHEFWPLIIDEDGGSIQDEYSQLKAIMEKAKEQKLE